jgi:hypothetical protein
VTNEKEKVIKKLGLLATINYLDGTTKQTKCLMSKASTQFNSMLSLEAHRKGDFIYSDNVQGGCIIRNDVNNEEYLVVGTYLPVFKDMVLSTTCHMVFINALLTVSRDSKKADTNGNVKVVPVDVYPNMKVFIQAVDANLRQTDAGILDDAEYLVYASKMDLNLLDKLALTTSDGKTISLKAVHLDPYTYDGVVVIQAKTETRK